MHTGKMKALLLIWIFWLLLVGIFGG